MARMNASTPWQVRAWPLVVLMGRFMDGPRCSVVDVGVVSVLLLRGDAFN
jgi:hypothetical protein